MATIYSFIILDNNFNNIIWLKSNLEQSQFSLWRYVFNSKFKMAVISSFFKLRQNRNFMVKTKSRYQFSLRRYVDFNVFKFKNSKWPLFLHVWSCVKTVIKLNEQNHHFLRQIHWHITGTECHKGTLRWQPIFNIFIR